MACGRSAHDFSGPPHGSDRIIPLAPDIRPVVQSRMALELAFAVAARAVLVLSPLGSHIQDDNQLSSQLTSYSRRKQTSRVYLMYSTSVNTTT
jgi:hypothetical protein